MTDVVIGGGGPAGLAAAISLAERGACVVVVDAIGGVSPQRAELLAHGAGPIIERLGLTDILQKSLMIKEVHSLWGAAKLQAHGTYPTLGLHGWGVDRHALSLAMLQRARNLGVTVRTARITGQTQISDGWRVELCDGSGSETTNTPFMIDATGRPARIARRLGATLLQGADLIALTWKTSQFPYTNMQSEATSDGWWYAVPHANGGTVGFMTSAAHAKTISLSPTKFLRHAQKDLGLISVACEMSDLRIMDARSTVLDKASDIGWLATGDASAAFDPITSQGLFNALSGGFFAGQAAADALEGDLDAPLVYEALVAQTADRTHATTHLQYAAMPYETEFWRQRNGSHAPAHIMDNGAMSHV